MRDLIIALDNYQADIKAINTELQTLPPGQLVKRRSFYCNKINGKEVGITEKTTLIQQLCRKKYLLARKKELEKNISNLSSCNLIFSTPKETINSLPKAYQGLPISYFFHSSITEWLAKSYPITPFPLDEIDGIKSEKGIIFRSKSEYIIATLLDYYNIPYRYEDGITLDGKNFFPDFRIKNPFTGKDFIWEHFGALHEPTYGTKMNQKMSSYMKHGYIPFKNLICTFEPDIKNTDLLRSLIENIILEVYN